MPHELTTKQIEDIAFAVLRSHNDDRLWRALTYDSGPYDVTKATLALQDLASAFFHAGLASAPAVPAQAVTDAQINGAIRAQQFWRIAAQESGFTFGPELHDFARAVLALASAPAAPAQAVPPLSDAARDVLAERRRQVEAEGWTPAHDDEHDSGELAGAGAAYALHAADALHPQSQGDAYRDGSIPHGWCWADEWWKPTDPRRSLIKAGALILAELERIDRGIAPKAAQESGHG